ncbi:zinc finger protein 502-like [Poecilia reticulata]|uniref:zinc finger protein 502-like n=1 Tax=Poecilia reticulata TaxID=8081 RepID=UPI0004A475B3|nr:PREDICTED: zinc finger protein 502-like [Poecilia reticulata]
MRLLLAASPPEEASMFLNFVFSFFSQSGCETKARSQMEDIEAEDKSHMSGSVSSLPENYSSINRNETHDDCMSKDHQCIHTRERPYSCDHCEKRFIRKGDLMSHQRIHTGERPYSCDLCEKRFIRKSGLMSHQHIHTGVRPYSCDHF